MRPPWSAGSSEVFYTFGLHFFQEVTALLASVMQELEARVREAQRSRAALQQRVAELEGGTAKERLARGGPEVVLSGEELRALRQEVAEQEALIQGYQAENEKLVERIKEMQKQYKSERQELQREHERLAGHLAQVENETHTQQSSADVAAHLQKILQLEVGIEHPGIF